MRIKQLEWNERRCGAIIADTSFYKYSIEYVDDAYNLRILIHSFNDLRFDEISFISLEEAKLVAQLHWEAIILGFLEELDDEELHIG